MASSSASRSSGIRSRCRSIRSRSSSDAVIFFRGGRGSGGEEVVLCAALEFQLAVLRLAFGHPVGRPQEILLYAHDVADGPVVNALHGLDLAGVKAAVQARHEAELLLFGQVARLLHQLDAQRISAMRLLHKDVFAGADARSDER